VAAHRPLWARSIVDGPRGSASLTVTATARKLAILVYRALTGELVCSYSDPGADPYDAQQRARIRRRLRQRAQQLGFVLLSQETGEVLGG